METIPSETPKPVPKYKTKDYYREYYHNKVKHIHECPLCGCCVVGNNSKLFRHVSTRKCQSSASNALVACQAVLNTQ